MRDFYAQVQSHGARYPADTALIHWRGRDVASTTTWSDLARLSSDYRGAFLAAKLKQKVLPLLLPKSRACVAAIVGAIGAGVPFACLSRKLRGPQVSEIISSAGAGLALVDPAAAVMLKDTWRAQEALACATWWLVEPESAAAPQMAVLEAMRRDGCRLVAEPLFEDRSARSSPARLDLDRVGCCLFTSGSTGAPKGVLIGLDDLVARAAAEVDCFGLSRHDVLLSLLPFSFDVGLNQLLSALTVGCTLVVVDSWLPADIRTAAAATHVTGISGVPSIWLDMLQANIAFDTAHEHRALKYLTVSGGDLLARDLARLPSLAAGAGVYKTYGQTEAFRATCLRPEEFALRPQSVGRAFGSAHVYVVSPDGTPVLPGELGEVVHTGLGVMRGYLDGDDPERKLRPNPFLGLDDPSPNAVFTGDLGYLDAEGYLFLQGRRDAMLKVAGNRVYPREIQVQALTIDGVAEAEFIGVKDSVQGTVLVGFVVPAFGADITASPVRRRLAALLPGYMVPSFIEIVPMIPRTASGKTDYPALRERAQRLLTERE